MTTYILEMIGEGGGSSETTEIAADTVDSACEQAAACCADWVARDGYSDATTEVRWYLLLDGKQVATDAVRVSR